MKNTNLFFLFILIGVIISSTAQDRPPINVFAPSDYKASSQNWSISQSKNRYIYVANNSGLLEFNGAKWSLYNSPNETIIRSVKVVDDFIYTGSYHDFGYWKKNDYGLLIYTSLAEKLGVDFLEDEEFWNILVSDNLVVFQSLDRIHIYNSLTSSYNIIPFEGDISRLFKSGNSFFFQGLNKGLFKIENSKAVLISDNEILKSDILVNIHEKDNKTVLLTRNNGFFKLTDEGLKTWEIPAAKLLEDVSVFSSIQLKDKSFVLGTISNGIIHLSKKGDFIFKIAQEDGLSNNTVLALYEDLDNNLWLGLDNGINCVNMTSPYSIYYDKTGRIGSVYASAVHNGFLYLGTNQGLFYRSIKGEDSFKFVKGTQGQVWFLSVIGATLFCGHNSGTLLVANNTATKIASVQGTWVVKQIPEKRDLLIQGNYDGLYILENNEGTWQIKNKIKGFDVSSRFFEFSGPHEIYLSHEYKGIYNLQLDKNLSKVERFALDSTNKNGPNSSVTRYNSALLYSTKYGVFKLNKNLKVFEKDSLLSKLIDSSNFTSAKLVNDRNTNKLWSFSQKGINYLTTSKLSGEMKITKVPFPEDIREDVVGYESVSQIEDQRFLLGSRSGYIVLDLSKQEIQNHEININQIEVSKLINDDSGRLVDITKSIELDKAEKNIDFSYSITEFLKTQKPEYRYKLEGIYDEWSDWTTTGNVLFKNLPFGKYNFVVKGRVGNKLTLNEASYAFTIPRPWFLSNTAIAGYIAAVLLFSLFMHTVYKRYYKKQRERLMLKTTREFELKELENKQQLMRFRNDKLREDIENKNRELGISTMSLIKKNEFLSTLKNELEQVNDTNNLKKVIRIIDRNLNNNDDWNLFQEAFNNADKDFLKKIKSLHPNLTSNDLRLCAYLRLNLSSKEIAPLLNISPRSVEVKRYRLRKKMGLQHEASLSDYILEI